MGLFVTAPDSAKYLAQKTILHADLQYAVLNIFEGSKPGEHMIIAKRMGSYNDFAVWLSWTRWMRPEAMKAAGIYQLESIDVAYNILSEEFLKHYDCLQEA